MGVVGEVELWEAGVRVGVGGEVEAEVVAGVFVGVVVGGGMEVEGGVEEVVLGRVWHEVVGVELGGENACGEVVGVVADFIDVSVWKRARGDDERTVAAAVVRVGILGAEYGGVEAGAVLAGLWPVVDDHGGERRVDVAVGRGDHARTESIRPMLTSAYEIHLPLPYPAPPKIRRSTIIYLFYRPPPRSAPAHPPVPDRMVPRRPLWAVSIRPPAHACPFLLLLWPPSPPTCSCQCPPAPQSPLTPPQPDERTPLIPHSDDTPTRVPSPPPSPRSHTPSPQPRVIDHQKLKVRLGSVVRSKEGSVRPLLTRTTPNPQQEDGQRERTVPVQPPQPGALLLLLLAQRLRGHSPRQSRCLVVPTPRAPQVPLDRLLPRCRRRSTLPPSRGQPFSADPQRPPRQVRSLHPQHTRSFTTQRRSQ